MYGSMKTSFTNPAMAKTSFSTVKPKTPPAPSPYAQKPAFQSAIINRGLPAQDKAPADAKATPMGESGDVPDELRDAIDESQANMERVRQAVSSTEAQLATNLATLETVWERQQRLQGEYDWLRGSLEDVLVGQRDLGSELAQIEGELEGLLDRNEALSPDHDDTGAIFELAQQIEKRLLEQGQEIRVRVDKARRGRLRSGRSMPEELGNIEAALSDFETVLSRTAR